LGAARWRERVEPERAGELEVDATEVDYRSMT
jgi:hypothetical protein